MKKALVLLSMSILLVSCMEKQQEEVVLDKEDQKIIEEVLDINNESEEKVEVIKNDEETIIEVEKNEEEKVKKLEVPKELSDKEIINKITKEETETTEEDKVSDDIINDILNLEGELDDAISNVEK